MEQNLKHFAELIKDLKSIYLAGGIQLAPRPDSWRNIMSDFLERNDIKAFNPVEDNSEIFNQSVLGYKEDGTEITVDELQDLDEMKEAMLYKQTEINDKKAIKDADVIFFYYDDRIGHGTRTEFDWACDMKKPIIIVRRTSRKSVAHWNKWRRYFALAVNKHAIEVRDLTEVKDFFKKYLGFKDDK